MRMPIFGFTVEDNKKLFRAVTEGLEKKETDTLPELTVIAGRLFFIFSLTEHETIENGKSLYLPELRCLEAVEEKDEPVFEHEAGYTPKGYRYYELEPHVLESWCEDPEKAKRQMISEIYNYTEASADLEEAVCYPKELW